MCFDKKKSRIRNKVRIKNKKNIKTTIFGYALYLSGVKKISNLYQKYKYKKFHISVNSFCIFIQKFNIIHMITTICHFKHFCKMQNKLLNHFKTCRKELSTNFSFKKKNVLNIYESSENMQDKNASY